MQGVYYLGNISSAGIFIAGFVINFFIYRAGGAYFFDLILSTTAIASGNTIGAIVGAHFLERKVLFNNRTFFRLERIFSFLFFVVFIPSVITSFTGGLATYLSGLADGVFQKIHSWLVADLIGVLVFVPLIITWIESPELKINRHKILEFSILLILLIISNYFIFSDFFKNHLYNILIAYFSTPLYIWLAFRFEKKVIASILFLALV
jgi:integral membrane sensor domain MASE1